MSVALKAQALDPVSVKDALSRPDADLWIAAMKDEMDSHAKSKTWELVDRPPDQNVLTCRWLFKSKLNSDGSLNKYKARLVVRGNNQEFGIDYEETFAPVARAESVRIVLSIAAFHDMEMKQFDIKTAFLNGTLEETVFMKQPQAYDDGSGRVCLLKKSLYGLKQAPRNWNHCFDLFAREEGFIPTVQDVCIYVKKSEKELMIMSLYVDDGLLCSTSASLLDQFMVKLKARFEITVNDPKVYVGMEIHRDRKKRTISISQSGYVNRVLEKFGMEDCRPVACPLDPSLKLVESTPAEAEEAESIPYLEAIGCLTYLSTISRPDISFAVSKLASFNKNPSVTHWNQAKRVIRYLKGTPDFKLTFGGRGSMLLDVSCDSDWGGDTKECRSTSGFVATLNGYPVTWMAKLQRKSALSTPEAEYNALIECLKEVLWMRPLLKSLGSKQSGPSPIHVDNQGAISLSKNPEFHRATKYIGVKFYRLRQEQEEGRIKIDYVESKKNPADMFTKALGPTALKECLSLINLCNTMPREEVSWMWHSLSCLAMNCVNSLQPVGVFLHSLCLRILQPVGEILPFSLNELNGFLQPVGEILPFSLNELNGFLQPVEEILPFLWMSWMDFFNPLKKSYAFLMENSSTRWNFLHIITLYTMRMASAITALIRKPLIQQTHHLLTWSHPDHFIESFY